MLVHKLITRDWAISGVIISNCPNYTVTVQFWLVSHQPTNSGCYNPSCKCVPNGCCKSWTVAVCLSSSLIHLCFVGNVFEYQPYEDGCWERVSLPSDAGTTELWLEQLVGCRTEQNPNRQSRLVVLESLGIRERTSLWIQPSIKADWFVTVQVLSSHTMKQTLSVNNLKKIALDQVLKTKWFNTTTTKLLCLRQGESFAKKKLLHILS